jgi:hypothetical protein
VTESVPTGSVLAVKVAMPEAFSAAVPKTVVPLLKVTVPIGTPAPAGPVTVAVKTIAVPAFTPVADSVKAVVVGAGWLLTVMAWEVEVDPA